MEVGNHRSPLNIATVFFVVAVGVEAQLATVYTECSCFAAVNLKLCFS